MRRYILFPIRSFIFIRFFHFSPNDFWDEQHTFFDIFSNCFLSRVIVPRRNNIDFVLTYIFQTTRRVQDANGNTYCKEERIIKQIFATFKYFCRFCCWKQLLRILLFLSPCGYDFWGQDVSIVNRLLVISRFIRKVICTPFQTVHTFFNFSILRYLTIVIWKLKDSFVCVYRTKRRGLFADISCVVKRQFHACNW